MAAQIKVKVVTPAGVLLETEAREVVLPTAAGEITVLPSHAHHCGVLVSGTVRITDAAQGTVRALTIAGGGITNVVHDVLVLAVDAAE